MDRGEHNNSRNSYYALLVLAAVVVLLAIPATFVSLVDPYQLLDTDPIEDVNEHKTSIFFHLSTTKAYQFRRDERNNLVLGTSRAGHAIDPGHPALSGERYYNFATPGSQPVLDRIKLEAALARGHVDKAIFFVDFFTFNTLAAFPAGFVDGFAARLAGTDSPATSPRFLQQSLYDFAAYFWSYQSIRDSATTLRQQALANSGAMPYTALHKDGRWDIHYATSRQTLQAFRQVEKSYLSGNWFPPKDPRFSLNETALSPNRAFSEFARILELAYQNNVDMTVVLLPVHARLLENLDYAGLWQHLEYWKRRLVALNTKSAEATGNDAFAIWDFNGYYPLATESVTQDTQTDALKWMKDSGHISKAAGDAVLDVISGRANTPFGGLMHAGNIDDWLARQRELRDAYRAQHPDIVKQVKQQVTRFGKRKPWQVVPLSD